MLGNLNRNTMGHNPSQLVKLSLAAGCLVCPPDVPLVPDDLTHGDADVDGGGADALHAGHDAAVGPRVPRPGPAQVEAGLQGAVIAKLDLDPVKHLMIKFSENGMNI